MAYEDHTIYTPYLTAASTGIDCNTGCQCCQDGLVAVYNSDGKYIGCLTPADAQEYNTNNVYCTQGFLALYKAGSPATFIGCVSQDDFLTLYQALNP